jgi:hypothetical protein
MKPRTDENMLVSNAGHSNYGFIAIKELIFPHKIHPIPETNLAFDYLGANEGDNKPGHQV